MPTKSLIRLTLLSVSVMCAIPAYAAGDASMHEVYMAAEAGKFAEAQGMMDKVLHNHPNSAKAHFVEAELLAKQGLLSQAEAELANAERIAPGLPFAKPAAVDKLHKHIAALHAPVRSSYAPVASPAAYSNVAPAPATGGLPWNLLLGSAGLIAFIMFAMRFIGRRAAPSQGMQGGNGNYNGTPTGQPYQQYGGMPAGGSAMGPGAAGGGIGSGIMGGLATGAAVGAGIVAGEALMHHFTDGNRNSTPSAPPPVPGRNDAAAPDDMGGNDFGVSDSSSWDDGGASGGDDWN